MTAIAVLLVTLTLILIPLAWTNYQQRSSREARIAQAWHDAREKQRGKRPTLAALEQRLSTTIAAEQTLLDAVRQLNADIEDLNSAEPGRDALADIDVATETALQRLATLIELQVDSEGRPRLTETADQLAARHADTRTSLARLDDVLHEGDEAHQPKSEAKTSPADSTDDGATVAPDQATMMPPPGTPSTEHRVH